MPAMTGGGQVVNSIEYFRLRYCLTELLSRRLHGNRCRTKNGIFEAISRFDCYIPQLSGEHRSKRAIRIVRVQENRVAARTQVSDRPERLLHVASDWSHGRQQHL